MRLVRYGPKLYVGELTGVVLAFFYISLLSKRNETLKINIYNVNTR
jgi:hypothetical protein